MSLSGWGICAEYLSTQQYIYACISSTKASYICVITAGSFCIAFAFFCVLQNDTTRTRFLEQNRLCPTGNLIQWSRIEMQGAKTQWSILSFLLVIAKFLAPSQQWSLSAMVVLICTSLPLMSPTKVLCVVACRTQNCWETCGPHWSSFQQFHFLWLGGFSCVFLNCNSLGWFWGHRCWYAETLSESSVLKIKISCEMKMFQTILQKVVVLCGKLLCPVGEKDSLASWHRSPLTLRGRASHESGSVLQHLPSHSFAWILNVFVGFVAVQTSAHQSAGLAYLETETLGWWNCLCLARRTWVAVGISHLSQSSARNLRN